MDEITYWDLEEKNVNERKRGEKNRVKEHVLAW